MMFDRLDAEGGSAMGLAGARSTDRTTFGAPSMIAQP